MGRHAVGYDIDPLAHLISQVKSHELNDDEVEQAYQAISKKYLRDMKALYSAKPPEAIKRRATPPDFPNRDYWFKPEVSDALSLLSYHIAKTLMPSYIRDFFWVAFSSLILAKTSVANARDIIHSRHHFWEHPKAPNVLSQFDVRIKIMRKRMAEYSSVCKEAPHCEIKAHLGDARCLPIENETIDLIFTSPPYATALDYPRAHFLSVAWMEKVLGLTLEEYRQKAHTYIGSERGQLAKTLELEKRLSHLDLTQSIIGQIAENSKRHAKLTQRYFIDMYSAFGEMGRVLKEGQHIIIVICPSHIRKVEVPTHEVFAEMGKTTGLRLKRKYTRTINERKRILPYMKKEFGRRMSTEYVLIFQKK